MPSPKTSRLRRAVAVLVLAGMSFAVLPPAPGAGGPATVVREVRLSAAALVPESVPAARGPGDAVRPERETWSRWATTCAPIRFTALGLTWSQDAGEEVEVELSWGPAEDELGDPIVVHADPAEGPDPGSPDDAGIEGTPPVWTGEARCVRYRLLLPADQEMESLSAVFINTLGTADPSPLAGIGHALTSAWNAIAGVAAPAPAEARAAKPDIITRSGWGANESLRTVNCSGNPSYAESLKMAYVHHTVNSNDYTRADAAGIVRAIYSYHVHGRGYCDIAYNFLIDRFGRIYEGRYGGMAKPVIGGHAQGFNTGSTGVAAIGTFETKKPPKKVVRAYRRLLAWRLDVAHRNPKGRTKMISGGGSNQKFKAGEEVVLKVISGHKDTGYTACPGAKLYDRLPRIRKGARKIGLPKIFNPKQTKSEIQGGTDTVRYKATLSRILNWTITFTDANGAVVHALAGRNKKLDVTWNGRKGGLSVPSGTYDVRMDAVGDGGGVARPARFTLTVKSGIL